MHAAVRKRPFAGSATGRIWAIADELFTRSGMLPSGREVVDVYLREDPSRNEGTAFTQYSHWKKAHLDHFKRSGRAPVVAAGLTRARLTVGGGGQIALPLDILQALDVSVGEALIATVVDGELRLVSAQAALAKARDLVRRFDTGQGSPVDELIRERRREANAE